MSRFFVLFGVYLSFVNFAFGEAQQRFILALECPNIISYSRFDGETFRGLKFDQKEVSRKGADFTSQSPSLLSALAELSKHSSQRADEYRRESNRIVGSFQMVEHRSLRPDAHRFRDLNLPDGCDFFVVSVLRFDTYGELIAGYVDGAGWAQLSFLDQKLLWIEIFSSSETRAEANEWSSRLFAESVLAKNSGFEQDETRFELLKQLGFSYAETKDFNGLCWDIQRPVKWRAGRPIAGYGWSEFRFSSLCKISWREQQLHLSGFFKLSAGDVSAGFEFLSVTPLRKNDKSYYRDSQLSKKFKTELVFIGGTAFDEMPLEFYHSGELKFGYVFSESHLRLAFSGHWFHVGLQKIGSVETWQNSPVAFWPNGHPRRMGRAYGQVTIRGRAYELVSDQIYFFENGALECASFKPGTEFESRDGTKLRISNVDYYTCFDRDGYPRRNRFGFHYADKMAIESYYPFQGDPGYVLPQKVEFKD